MNLEHYSKKPFVFDRGRVYTQDVAHTFGKPKGLWVSVASEDDWPAWCQGEGFLVDSLKHVAVVELHKNANVRSVSSKEELLAFHDQYSIQGREFIPFDREHEHLYRSMDWGKVAANFDGLVIAPYLWSCRFEPQWYYGWDCASGVVWNLSAIDTVEEVKND